jgi:glycosyltransferase involved in cell wall biosynthesis
VTPGWVDNLQRAAYSRKRVGTVTPLTNNGTICSLPQPLTNNLLPFGYDAVELARLIQQVSRRQYPPLPTCVGFCVYIRREAIDRVGLLDHEAFGRGYGEENDFSCRAQAAGFADLLDDATFVYHRGGSSFGEDSESLTAQNLKVLAQKHPRYCRRVRRFIKEDSLRPIRAIVGDALVEDWNRRQQLRVLHVLHDAALVRDFGRPLGGVQYHVADLVAAFPNAAHWTLHPIDGGLRLTAHVGSAEKSHCFCHDRSAIAEILNPELFPVLHVHQTLGFCFEAIVDDIIRHGNYIVSLHDYAFLCPLINLITTRGSLCSGKECVEACGQSRPRIEAMRQATERLLASAARVVHFSEDTRTRFARIVSDNGAWEMIEHGCSQELFLRKQSRKETAVPEEPGPTNPLRVVFVGGLSYVKGSAIVGQLIQSRDVDGTPVDWHVVGSLEGGKRPRAAFHGRYTRRSLPSLLGKINPHLAVFLSIWPETYGLAVDEALAAGIPVVVGPLGAPAERVRRDRTGWVLPKLDVPEVRRTLAAIAGSREEYLECWNRVNRMELRSWREASARYDEIYRDAGAGRPSIDSAALFGRLEKLMQAHCYREPRKVGAGAVRLAVRLLDATGQREFAESVARAVLPKRVADHLYRLQMPQQHR